MWSENPGIDENGQKDTIDENIDNVNDEIDEQPQDTNVEEV
jgi:hypothetical protein